FEPGACRIGIKLRQLLLTDEGTKPQAHTEALLFAAERAAHVQDIIIPALNAGHIVLCDRFTDSTLAYQGGGRGLSEVFLRQLNDFASFGLKPDRTFYLELPLAIARERQGLNKDRLEQEDEDFFLRITAVYKRLAAAEPQRIKTIDAAQTTKKVLADLLLHIPQYSVEK
ncbi:MAG: dTMP kinase, partial [Firmicutes bacterium]|nr:dTMP kinase [Bacillota bacterium]